MHDSLIRGPMDCADKTVMAFKSGPYSKRHGQTWLVSRGIASKGTFDLLTIPFQDRFSLVSKDH